MLAGGQIAGVSGLLPHCFELKPSRSHASGVTPQHDQLWLKDWVMKWSLALILWLRLVSPLPVCLFIPVVVRLCPNSSMDGCFLDIASMCLYAHGQTNHITHFTSIPVLPEVELWSRRPGWMRLLLCCAGVNVYCACGFEFEHDINMLICTCAWLSCMSLLSVCLRGLIFVLPR